MFCVMYVKPLATFPFTITPLYNYCIDITVIESNVPELRMPHPARERIIICHKCRLESNCIYLYTLLYTPLLF